MRGCVYTISELCGLLHIKLNYLDHKRAEKKKKKNQYASKCFILCRREFGERAAPLRPRNCSCDTEVISEDVNRLVDRGQS